MIILSFIIFGSIQFDSFATSDVSSHHFKVQKWQKYDTDAFLTRLHGIRSMTVCLGTCTKNENCARVNYHKSTKVCELISLGDVNNSFLADSDWNHGYFKYNNHHNQDCQTLRENGCLQNGVYSIQPDPNQPAFNVYCDMQDGGWTVIQRRYDGSVPFYNKTWNEYKTGFGDLSGEHWLGNDNIHILTTSASYEIKFDLMTTDNILYNAAYSHFVIQDESENYKLSIGSYLGGSAGDSIWTNGIMLPGSEPEGMKFSTTDRDNDAYTLNCADLQNGGGWWYRSCSYALLNGKYSHDETSLAMFNSIKWHPLTGTSTTAGQPLKATAMKLRRTI